MYKLAYVILFLVFTTFISESFSFQTCQIPSLKNGRVKVRSQGRSLTFKCLRRFTLFGEYSDAVCYKGHWVPGPDEFPRCIKRGCEIPRIPSNGFLWMLYDDAAANFHCYTGKKHSQLNLEKPV